MPRNYNRLIKIEVISREVISSEAINITINGQSVNEVKIDMTKISIISCSYKGPKELEEIGNIMLIHDNGVLISFIGGVNYLVNGKDKKDIVQLYKTFEKYMSDAL
jgi:hypothetical protein